MSSPDEQVLRRKLMYWARLIYQAERIELITGISPESRLEFEVGGNKFEGSFEAFFMNRSAIANHLKTTYRDNLIMQAEALREEIQREFDCYPEQFNQAYHELEAQIATAIKVDANAA